MKLTVRGSPLRLPRAGIQKVIVADVAQLVRAPPCHGGGHEFNSRYPLDGKRLPIASAGGIL